MTQVLQWNSCVETCVIYLNPAVQNPLQGFVGRALGEPGLKPSIRVGEAAIREVAAFLLDHDHFSSVPHTVLVKVSALVFISAARVA